MYMIDDTSPVLAVHVVVQRKRAAGMHNVICKQSRTDKQLVAIVLAYASVVVKLGLFELRASLAP